LRSPSGAELSEKIKMAERPAKQGKTKLLTRILLRQKRVKFYEQGYQKSKNHYITKDIGLNRIEYD